MCAHDRDGGGGGGGDGHDRERGHGRARGRAHGHDDDGERGRERGRDSAALYECVFFSQATIFLDRLENKKTQIKFIIDVYQY